MAEYYLKKLNLPFELILLITTYLPSSKYKEDIKHKKYLSETGFWFKRIIKKDIVDIKRHEMSYYDWYKIFHYKEYSILIKFENKLIKQLLKTKTKEEIEKIHMDNIKRH
tara:strand:+ start:159 stop:488 length:330 start_codon:yes stop_codon:yes gene_type:complete